MSSRRRILYCHIPKVACSSLKLWFKEIEEGDSDIHPPAEQEDERKSSIHTEVDERFSYRRHVKQLGGGPLRDPRWFRFAFVRNPWTRLVSAFVNKFVQWTDLGEDLVAEFRSRLPTRCFRRWCGFDRTSEDSRLKLSDLFIKHKDWAERFTFRHFVEHLTTCDMASVDLHWRPQVIFLADTDFHFLGRFEHLERDMAAIRHRLGLKGAVRRENATTYEHHDDSGECVADWPLAKLRELPAKPLYRRFYSPDLAQIVGELYAADVERFDYQFDAPAAEPATLRLRRAA